VPAPVVSCQTDLPLSASPDAPYNFLCRSGDRPLTWPSSHLVIYDTGLSVLQLAALQLAVPQWEQAGGFSATFGSNPATADVVVTAAPLGSGAPGYTEDGYTTVAYRCSPRCAYVHARVVLSSTASLTSTDWLSTLLHELGHVAGLNHVSRRGEVMYPYLTLTSPVLYAAGDRQGFQVLAAERATSP
jgi:predicted Zn-dependent protease